MKLNRLLLGVAVITYPVLNAWLSTSDAGTDIRWLMVPDVLVGLGLIASLRRDPLQPLWWALLGGLTLLGSLNSHLAGLPPAALYLLVARHFERSLNVPGALPLITEIAARAHGPDQPLSWPVIRYTRGLTAAWMWFLMLLAGLGGLSATLGNSHWALMFSNTIGPLLLTLFLLGEIPIRRLCLPKEQRTPFITLVKLLLRDGWTAQSKSP